MFQLKPPRPGNSRWSARLFVVTWMRSQTLCQSFLCWVAVGEEMTTWHHMGTLYGAPPSFWILYFLDTPQD